MAEFRSNALQAALRRAVKDRKLWVGAGAAAAFAGVCGAYAQGVAQGVLPAPALGSFRSIAPAPIAAPTYAVSQSALFRSALSAAERGDVASARSLQGSLTDPVARKVVLWAMIDHAGTSVDFFTLEAAKRDLAGWPRPARLEAAAEKAMEATALPPAKVVAWFAGRDPQTPEGTMALTSAYQQSGRVADAQALVKRVWRGRVFGADAQSAMLSRFGIYLTSDDHAARLSMLLYAGPSAASHAMEVLVGPDQQALARAREALHAERGDATLYLSQVPASLQNDPGLAFDHARYLRKHNLDSLAVNYVRSFSTTLSPDVSGPVWAERRALLDAALQTRDYKGAYTAATGHGLTEGTDYTEAEFFAGWLALSKMHDAALADTHFAKLQAAAKTPITISRALYWRGRAAAARGDATAAQGYWTEGAKYYTTFYGQLSAEKAGQTRLAIGADPVPTGADRAAFNASELVRAARLLGDAGEREDFRTFVLAIADAETTTAAQLALLVDMAKLYGEQDTAMRAVRAGALHSVYLPERGYPVRAIPQSYGSAEPAFALAITRQESNFDPNARSSVGARGMMQLMPGTAASVARRVGVGYSPGSLNDADYNLRLGAAYLGQITSDLGGSYLMAAAGYNAGPGRAIQWAATCGDPRQGSADPADYIECIPFTESRNYTMRVMEALMVYRARLNGGSTPLTLSAELHRGGWTPGAPSSALAYRRVGEPVTAAIAASAQPAAVATMAPPAAASTPVVTAPAPAITR